jgi:hypothetical protein
VTDTRHTVKGKERPNERAVGRGGRQEGATRSLAHLSTIDLLIAGVMPSVNTAEARQR